MTSRQRFLTFVIVAGSSILFCSKGVVAKLAYAKGADALTVLTLRMAFAFPFFLGMAVMGSRGKPSLRLDDWLKLMGLGFVGYYLSSLVNFTGLQTVSVGLERIVLYTYPSMVLGISAFVLRKKVPAAIWIASGISWLGIVAAFIGEAHSPVADSGVIRGTSLILTSALTYATFILLSGDTIRRVGSMRFTGIAVGFSCLLMLAHAGISGTFAELPGQPGIVYFDCLVIALFGTVAPAFLLAVGLRRTTPQQFAIIGTVGPVTTLFLAWAVLSEAPNPGQILGFALALIGGLSVSLRGAKPAVEPEAAVRR